MVTEQDSGDSLRNETIKMLDDLHSRMLAVRSTDYTGYPRDKAAYALKVLKSVQRHAPDVINDFVYTYAVRWAEEVAGWTPECRITPAMMDDYLDLCEWIDNLRRRAL